MPGREKVLGYRPPEEGWKRVQSAAGPLRRSGWILGWSEPVLGREGERKWAVPTSPAWGCQKPGEVSRDLTKSSRLQESL